MSRAIVQLKTDKRSKKVKQADFLIKFSACASVSKACKQSKVPRQTIYDWFKSDIEFKLSYDNICAEALGALEDEAVRRAFEGSLKPVYQGGKKVGAIREYSDTLLIVLLKARAPEKYKERIEQKNTTVATNTNTNYNYAAKDLTEEEIKNISKALEDAV